MMYERDLVRELDRFSRESGPLRMDADYLETLSGLLTEDSVVLDAGCGHEGIFSRSELNSRARRKTVIGVDSGADKNPYMDEQHVADLAALPFPDNTFDIIVSEWVAEHVAEPVKVFAEFSRVLRDGGHVVLLTPNRNNPLVWLGGAIPSAFKDWLLRSMLKKDDRDLFPVYLRMNTPAAIHRHAKTAGFDELFLKTYPNPEYFMWNSRLLQLVLRLEQRMIAWQWPRRFNMYILAAYSKPQGK
ncbi:MAG: class I SAM-dependent methyltransferase [Thermoleophilia bacterium]